jgi:hypothetical protein
MEMPFKKMGMARPVHGTPSPPRNPTQAVETVNSPRDPFRSRAFDGRLQSHGEASAARWVGDV